MKIYTTFGKQKTIKEFLTLLFSSEYNTYRLNVTTFNDPECTQQQCPANKLRSFDDILDCVNTYYKNITPKKLIHLLLTLNLKDSKGKSLYLHMGTCAGIRRIRMLFYLEEDKCYHFSKEKYNSKWSWSELLEMLNLKTVEEVKNYVKNNIK